MTSPTDRQGIPPHLARLLDARTPAPLRTMAAKGIAPGVRPHDALTVVALLSEGDDAVAEVARATLAAIPGPLLAGALVPELPAWVVDLVAPTYARDADVALKLLSLAQIELSTVVTLAAIASEAVAELIATNEERMIREPSIIEKLYLNKATRMSTSDRLIELAVRNGIELRGIPAFAEAAAAIQGELIAEPTDEPTFDDVLFTETATIAEALAADPEAAETHEVDEESGEEKVKEKVLPIHAKLAEMSISQRIRRAMLGTASERAILVRDNNKLVAQAAIKSPMIQENEVVRIASSRSVSEEVLNTIARSGNWMRQYQIKLNLVQNPRAPFGTISKLISHLRDNDLKSIAKSKNVSGQVQLAAKQHLARKSK